MTSFRFLTILSTSALFAGLWACSSDNSAGSGSTADAGTTLPTDSGTTTADAGCNAIPPTGFTQIVPTAAASGGDPGGSVAMTLDAAGNPVAAYLDGLDTARTLKTLRWDSCAGTWTTPVQVDTIGALDDTWSVAIATDASDGRIAIAYTKILNGASSNPTLAAFVAISTDAGKTFTPKQVTVETSGDATNVDSTVVALGGGKTFVAYNQGGKACPTNSTVGCRAGTVIASSVAGAAFTYEVVSDGVDADVSGHLIARSGFHIGIAVDANNVVAVATHAEPQTGYNTSAWFCRSGTTCSKVMDSQNAQNDDGSAELAFIGTTATVITKLHLGTSDTFDFRASTSTDGTTWSAVTPLPRDGDAVSSALSRTGITTNGTHVVLFASASQGTSAAKFGAPKIFTSGTPWTVSGADGEGTTQPTGYYPTGRLTKAGKYMLTFQGSVPHTDPESGVTFWFQP